MVGERRRDGGGRIDEAVLGEKHRHDHEGVDREKHPETGHQTHPHLTAAHGRPLQLSPSGLSLPDSYFSRGALAITKRPTQTVIAGLVPAIHGRSRLPTSPERLSAAAEWALGTSPRVTAGVVGVCATTTRDTRMSLLAPRPGPHSHSVAPAGKSLRFGRTTQKRWPLGAPLPTPRFTWPTRSATSPTTRFLSPSPGRAAVGKEGG